MIKRTGFLIVLGLFLSFTYAEDVHHGYGVITKISDDKVTISHEPIPSLKMKAMTMQFDVFDPVMLTPLKIGQKIKFTVQREKDANVIVAFEPK